jgi:tetratricopeptide (TPR) repeat protein
MEFQQELDALYQEALERKGQGRLADAEALESKAAEILQGLTRRVEQNPEDPAIAEILLYLADRQWAILGDHKKVLSQIERALDLCENGLGPNHVITAEAFGKLAEFHFLAGRFGEAEPFYRKSLSIYECQGVTGDLSQTKAFEGLAQTLAALGHFEEANRYFARAIEHTRSDEQGKRSLYFLLMTRADGLEKLNKKAEAQAHRQKAAALLPRGNPGEFGFQV